MSSKNDPMDVPAVLDGLRQAITLQHRSAIAYTLAAGSIFGLAYQGLADRFWTFAEAELHDLRLLIEKVVALGGEPPADMAPVQWTAHAEDAVDRLIDDEAEAIACLHGVIPHTGQQPESEALEHLLEHLIMRKQNQVDFLVRARRAD